MARLSDRAALIMRLEKYARDIDAFEPEWRGVFLDDLQAAIASLRQSAPTRPEGLVEALELAARSIELLAHAGPGQDGIERCHRCLGPWDDHDDECWVPLVLGKLAALRGGPSAPREET